ncbi:hypothetical protein J4727_15545 [Providencia rettgeri]|uniref:Uncharacterized protein n=1 Tax=Providencia rettgeri TaxID=587 RepID=A0A939NKP5_PRORE|nr:hypothetical protein [Providencia rettgeri]
MNNRSGYIKGQNLTIKAYSIDNQAGLIMQKIISILKPVI